MKRLSLFWKMYLGFLIALFLPLMINEIFFTIEKTRHQFRPPENIRRLLEWTTHRLAEDAAGFIERDDADGLAAFLAAESKTSGVDYSVSPHEETNGQNLEEGVVTAATPFFLSGEKHFLSASFSLFQGKPPFPLRRPWMLLIPMGVGALLCLLLVRHIVVPIQTLRGATMRLGKGDLAARAGDTVNGRGDAIADLGMAFDAMAERIEELLTSQHRLMGDISHELRSPLQRLDVALTLARKECTLKGKEFLDRADREAGRINEMVGQILNLAAAELSSPDMLRGTVDISVLLAEVAEDARFEGARDGKKIILKIASGPMVVEGDESLLLRALENVVRNALRVTLPGMAVELSAERKEGNVVVSVRDYGPGIPEEELRRIFRPFYRVDAARDRKSGGTGLGLAIAEKAVRCHDGSITARNACGDKGLVVEISLPSQKTENNEKNSAR